MSSRTTTITNSTTSSKAYSHSSRSSRPSSSSRHSSSSSHPSSSSRQSSPLRKHECTTCHRLFSRKDNLKAHTRIHSKALPYDCKYCGIPFRWIGVLRTHENIHIRQGDEVGKTLPTIRKRKDRDEYFAAKYSNEQSAPDSRSRPYSNSSGSHRSSRPHHTADTSLQAKSRYEHQAERVRRPSRQASGPRSLVVISDEDPTLDIAFGEPWHGILDDARY